MSRRNVIAPVILLVAGGLWIFLTGACSEALFRTMRDAEKLPLELLVTLPGCVLVLAGVAMLLTRTAAGVIVLAYAALLSLVWSSTVVGSNQTHPKGMLALLSIFNIPSVILAVWGLVLVLKRSVEPRHD